MIAQWENKCISLSVLPVTRVHYSAALRDFSLADHTLPTHPEAAWQKMAQSPLNGIAQPVEIEEEGRSPTTDRHG